MPDWPDTLPRSACSTPPRRSTPLPRFAAALGDRTAIWIKREDLLPIGLGGNKLRNLEFLVGAALAEGADTLVTTGRRWSNHARLTAAVGARAGLAVHLVLSGPLSDPPTPGVRLDELLGATVHLTATEDRAERVALQDLVVADAARGGAGPTSSGWAAAVRSARPARCSPAGSSSRQARAAGIRVDRIVRAVGDRWHAGRAGGRRRRPSARRRA